MEIDQRYFTVDAGWRPGPPEALATPADLVLVFASPALFRDPAPLAAVRRAHPGAQLFGCTTAGEICDVQVRDESMVVTAVRFAGTRTASAVTRLEPAVTSQEAGERLAGALSPDGLAHVLVLSDGLRVNGSDLVRGLTSRLPPTVTVTGGLSADGARFTETLVLAEGEPQRDRVAALGLYGDRIRVGCASLGGWDPFGPERLITRAHGNVLYELDGQSALELYRKYLGEHAAGLPATGLLFPLSLRTGAAGSGVVRTILGVNESEQSLTFAGDMPEGAYARLMKANFDRLIDGAMGAAKGSVLAGGPAELALLISCVGRKLLLKQRIEEEVEGVREVLGPGPVLTGFYSYGEISPFTPTGRCELHNQTMTITSLREEPDAHPGSASHAS